MYAKKTDYLERVNHPRMSFYRRVYKNSKVWNGKDSIFGKTIIIYCEQGIGDTIQFAGYFHYLKQLGCHTIVACATSLHRLFLQCVSGVDEVIDKSTTKLPNHDYHALSLSLPFYFPEDLNVKSPYINYKEKADLSMIPGKKIGIAWEGNPEHSHNDQRVCPLKYFKILAGQNVNFISLQKEMHKSELVLGAEDMAVYGIDLGDYLDTAALINALDEVVVVDTSVLHLAGAMGKTIHGLLSYQHDPRWFLSKWYSNIRIFKQPVDGDWETVFKDVQLSILAKQRITFFYNKVMNPVKDTILFDGGIGDIITLESFFTDKQRQEFKKVYLATKHAKIISELWKKLYPNMEIKTLDLKPPDGFAFYQKSEVTKALGDNKPEDWGNVEDWSIMTKFDMFDPDNHTYSSLTKKKLADISHFNLPEKYAVIVNCSPSDTRDRKRPLNKKDWKAIFAKLKRHGLKGVVLVKGNNPNVPNHPDIIDMSNQTTVLESIEILKNAKAYYGIDSFLSIIGSRVFSYPNLMVKTTNFKHLYRWRRIYYAPQKNFKFLQNKIV